MCTHNTTVLVAACLFVKGLCLCSCAPPVFYFLFLYYSVDVQSGTVHCDHIWLDKNKIIFCAMKLKTTLRNTEVSSTTTGILLLYVL